MRAMERLVRQESEDIIIIAEMIEGECGELVRAMITNLLNMELSHSRSDASSSDRKIGRLEAYRTILDDMDGFISRRDDLQRPIEREEQEGPVASEQVTVPVARGGEI